MVLLDDVAKTMRQKLKLTEKELPLAKVLQGPSSPLCLLSVFSLIHFVCPCLGGTWQAGRELAKKRKDKAPPILVRLDGSVF